MFMNPKYPLEVSTSLHSSPLQNSSNFNNGNNNQQNPALSSLNSTSVMGSYQSINPAANFVTPIIRTLEYIGAKSPDTPSAASVSYKLRKVINAEKKVLKRKHEFLVSMANWIQKLQSEENKSILVEFNRVIESQNSKQEELIRKEEAINLQLNHVSQREVKATELHQKRLKTFKHMREQERKNGENQATSLSKEALEELHVTIEVVYEQLVRSINTSLKGSLVDYVLSLQSNSGELKNGCNDFFEYLNTDVMFNLRKAYMMDGNNDPDKIQPISSRIASENKENELFVSDPALTSRKSKATSYLNPKIMPNEQVQPVISNSIKPIAEHDQHQNINNIIKKPSSKCPECEMFASKDGQPRHLENCSYNVGNNQSRKYTLMNEQRPDSSQSISLPGKYSVRVPSIIRSKLNETNIWSQ